MGSLTEARDQAKKIVVKPSDEKPKATSGTRSEKTNINFSDGMTKQVRKYGKVISIDEMQEIVDFFLDSEFINLFLTLSDHYKRTYMNKKRLENDAPKLAGITDKRNRKVFRDEGEVLIKAEKYGIKIDGVLAIKQARRKLWELYNSKVN